MHERGASTSKKPLHLESVQFKQAALQQRLRYRGGLQHCFSLMDFGMQQGSALVSNV